VVLPSAEAIAGSMRRETVTLTMASGSKAILAEIAISGPEQEQGLMFRTRMGDDEGMLFTYPKPQSITMWMRNTYLALDMVFIGGDGRVVRIEENAEPLSQRVIASGELAQSVLELKAGAAERLGLKRGDKVSAPSLKLSVP
jgi:uncharacterized protein